MTVILSNSEAPIQDEHGGKFDYQSLKEFKDKATGLNVNQVGTFNKLLFHSSYEIDECDHSKIEIKVVPQVDSGGQQLYLHVLIGNTEILQSPCAIVVEKSDKHKAFEQDQAALKKAKKDAKLQALRDKEAAKQK